MRGGRMITEKLLSSGENWIGKKLNPKPLVGMGESQKCGGLGKHSGSNNPVRAKERKSVDFTSKSCKRLKYWEVWRGKRK